MKKPEIRDVHVGDTRTVISATLQQMNDAGTAYEPVNLTGMTVSFKMVRPDGTVKRALSSAAITDAPGGRVQYDLQAADVDEPGTFYGYFVITSGAETDHFPAERKLFEIRVHGDV
jgi:hypothetical protein